MPEDTKTALQIWTNFSQGEMLQFSEPVMVQKVTIEEPQ